MSIFKKPQTKFGIWLLCFVLTAAIIATGTVAWFVMNTEVSISSPSDQNLAVQVNAGDLKVSVSYRSFTKPANDSSWYYGKFTEYSPYSDDFRITTASPQFIDVTGSGNTLWFPQSLDENDQPIYDNPNNWIEVTDSGEYCITLKVKFQTSQTMDIYLDKKSAVSAVEEVVSTSYVRSSGYGNFSVDGICGAVRVAFLEMTEEGAYEYPGAKLDKEDAIRNARLKYLWIPNDTYRLSYDAENAVYSYTTEGEREQYVYYEKTTGGVMDDTVLTATDFINGNAVAGNNNLADGAHNIVNAAAPLVSFKANGSVQEKEILIRIWFEGTDLEANTALDGGKIKYNFVFSGINKDEAELETQEMIEGISFYSDNLYFEDDTLVEGSTKNGAIMYSMNGIDWAQVVPGTVNHWPKGTYNIYVRSAETLTEKMSDVKVVVVDKTTDPPADTTESTTTPPETQNPFDD